MKKNIVAIFVLVGVYACIVLIVRWNSSVANTSEPDTSEIALTMIGTGFFISDDYVITATHVIENARDPNGTKRVILYPYDNEYREFSNNNGFIVAKIIYDSSLKEKGNDIALLKILGRVNNASKQEAKYIQSDEHDKDLEKIKKEEITPLKIAPQTPKIGEVVYMPGTACTERYDNNIEFFMYSAHVAGGQFNSGSYNRLYFDRPVHRGISGAPVINSDGNVIAMVNSCVNQGLKDPLIDKNSQEIKFPCYTHGRSGKFILDLFDQLKEKNINSDAIKTKESDLAFKNFPAIDNPGKSIVFIKVYSKKNSNPSNNPPE